MTYDVYRYIFYGGAILAAIMFIVSLVLFIVLKIPAVIGDLSGATARKAIENIRNQNESSGEKAYKSSAVNIERGKLTDKISPSGNLIKAESNKLGFGMKTEKISTQRLSVEEGMNETTILDSGNETTVLNSGNETTLLNSGGAGETTLLAGAMYVPNETQLYSGNASTSDDMEVGIIGKLPQIPVFFEVEQEITFVHTDEIIT